MILLIRLVLGITNNFTPFIPRGYFLEFFFKKVPEKKVTKKKQKFPGKKGKSVCF
jgi:hypothetical protein